MGEQSRLGVLLDGVPLPDEEARALWTRFSEHMDANKGDMAGFARLNGFASVAPEVRQGRAVLVVRTKAGAGAGAKAAGGASGGSRPERKPPPGPGSRGGQGHKGGGGGAGGGRRGKRGV